MHHTARRALMIAGTSATLALVGCGSGKSIDSITADLKAPTGTVDATSAKAIGPKLEGANGVPSFAGEREDTRSRAQAASASFSCPAGGTIEASGDGNANKGRTQAHYNNCCAQADCCFNGSADMFYDYQDSAEFNICMDYTLSFNCAVTAESTSASSSGSMDFSGCMSLSGGAASMVYLIEVNGLTYRVTGSYGNGSGTLEITGANGSYSCTYTSGSGTCTGTGSTSGSFSF